MKGKGIIKLSTFDGGIFEQVQGDVMLALFNRSASVSNKTEIQT